MKGCITCLNALAIRDNCEGCLGVSRELVTPEGTRMIMWEYNNYKEGNPVAELIKQQRSGERNIVLGGEGEHEVNVKWGIKQATKKLSYTCEMVGGLCWREDDNTIIVDTYHGAFHLVYEEDKLRRIFKRTHRDRPLLHWWTSTNDYDEFKRRILAAITEKELIALEKEFYSSDLDETEKHTLAEYMRARIGNI